MRQTFATENQSGAAGQCGRSRNLGVPRQNRRPEALEHLAALVGRQDSPELVDEAGPQPITSHALEPIEGDTGACREALQHRARCPVEVAGDLRLDPERPSAEGLEPHPVGLGEAAGVGVEQLIRMGLRVQRPALKAQWRSRSNKRRRRLGGW